MGWLTATLAGSLSGMSTSALEEFRERLVLDGARRAALLDAGDTGGFFTAALELAREWSLDLTMEDLETANRLGHQAWAERFIA